MGGEQYLDPVKDRMPQYSNAVWAGEWDLKPRSQPMEGLYDVGRAIADGRLTPRQPVVPGGANEPTPVVQGDKERGPIPGVPHFTHTPGALPPGLAELFEDRELRGGAGSAAASAAPGPIFSSASLQEVNTAQRAETQKEIEACAENRFKGFPQGAAMSAFMSILYLADIKLPEGVHLTMYADDGMVSSDQPFDESVLISELERLGLAISPAKCK